MKDNWELLAKYFARDVSEAEEHELKNWRNASAANEKEFLKAERLWTLYKPLELEWDTEQEWEKLNIQLQSGTVPSQSNFYNYWKLAAAAILIFGSLIIMNQYSGSEDSTASIKSEDAITSTYLPDSSKIWLNNHSHISYDYNAYNQLNRHVCLESGEAFFSVKRDTSQIFQVMTSGLEIYAIGTSFNVKVADGDSTVSITVASGTVGVQCRKCLKNDTVLLKTGDKAQYKASKKVIELSTDNGLKGLNWLRKDSIFSQESANPKDYLFIKSDWKSNILGMPIVSGTVYNQASNMSVDGLRIKATIYNKKGKKSERFFYLDEPLSVGENIAFRKVFSSDIFKYSSRVEVEIDSINATFNY